MEHIVRVRSYLSDIYSFSYYLFQQSWTSAIVERQVAIHITFRLKVWLSEPLPRHFQANSPQIGREELEGDTKIPMFRIAVVLQLILLQPQLQFCAQSFRHQIQ